MKKNIFVIIFIYIYISLIAQWNGPVRIGGFSSSFYPPVNSFCFVSDKIGNSYTVFHTNGPDFYYAIALIKYDGSSWSYSQIDEPFGGGDYSLSVMPSISVEDDGKYFIIWEDKKTGDIELFGKYFNLIDIPSLEQITFDSSYIFYPKVIYKNNAHHLMYLSNKTGVFNLYYKIYDSIWNDAENIYTTNNEINDFYFSIEDNGIINVVFTMIDNYYINLYYIKKESGVWQPIVSIFENNSNVYYPSILSDTLRDYIIYTANVSGINQLYISINENGIISNPYLLSDNSSNIYYPTGLLLDSNLYIFYVSDELPDGVLYCDIYNKNTLILKSREILLKEKGGEIYAPQVTVNSNNRIIVSFMCADTIHESVPNTLYYFYYDIVKNKKSDERSYKIIYSMENIQFISTDNENIGVEIFDKIGRMIYKKYSNTTIVNINKNIFKKSDIYFAKIINKTHNMERLLIIK